MLRRRILSLWFPRLGAERLMRAARGLPERPLAVVAEQTNMQVVIALNAEAEAAGLHAGQPVRDAHAMCAGLVTRARNVPAEAAFLTALRRWAGKFSPWVAEEPPDGLMIDLSGCAHLFGGEAALLEVGLARPSFDRQRIRPLLEMKIDGIDAGFGIDMLRLQAVQSESVHARTMTGHAEAGRAVQARIAGSGAVDDLIGKLGARVGLEVITRWHPAASHIPEKTAQILAAAWSEPCRCWPPPPRLRPLLMWPPEPVQAPDMSDPPVRFRWRGRDWDLALAAGPERIAPEWWLDDPNWRSGIRDYWAVTTGQGERLWLYYGHGGTMSPGWFCQGSFA